MSDLRGALAISNDVHAELMEAVRDGREPARVAAAAAARQALKLTPLRALIRILAYPDMGSAYPYRSEKPSHSQLCLVAGGVRRCASDHVGLSWAGLPSLTGSVFMFESNPSDAASVGCRALPNAVSGASSNQASDAHASALLPSGLHDVSTAFAASAAAGHAPGGQLKRR